MPSSVTTPGEGVYQEQQLNAKRDQINAAITAASAGDGGRVPIVHGAV